LRPLPFCVFASYGISGNAANFIRFSGGFKEMPLGFCIPAGIFPAGFDFVVDVEILQQSAL
jgi:hypothetical protein